MSTEKSLQETYAPKSVCFGCGPANPEGLHIRSFVQGSGEGESLVSREGAPLISRRVLYARPPRRRGSASAES